MSANSALPSHSAVRCAASISAARAAAISSLAAARPRQQNAAFLKGLADRGDAEAQRLGVVRALVGVELRPGNHIAVAGIDAAAGKHQRAGGEFDLIVPHHHEHFDLRGRGGVAQQQDGRGGSRRGRLSGHRVSLPFEQGFPVIASEASNPGAQAGWIASSLSRDSSARATAFANRLFRRVRSRQIGAAVDPRHARQQIIHLRLRGSADRRARLALSR